MDGDVLFRIEFNLLGRQSRAGPRTALQGGFIVVLIDV